MFLQNVKCLRYGTLRYVKVENTHYGSYGCSVTNITRFYFSRISVSSYQSRMNVKRYVTLREGGKQAKVEMSYVLICATRQKPCRKRVYRMFSTSVGYD